MSAARLRFLGAADTVTESRYLLESGERRLQTRSYRSMAVCTPIA
jgi:hypothetical protein